MNTKKNAERGRPGRSASGKLASSNKSSSSLCRLGRCGWDSRAPAGPLLFVRRHRNFALSYGVRKEEEA